MAVSVKADFEFPNVQIKGLVDKKGNPAAVDPNNPPTWVTSNSELIALTPSADGMSCKITPVGPVGPVSVMWSGDADLGDGVTTIQIIGELEITAGQAVVGTMDFGVAAAQP